MLEALDGYESLEPYASMFMLDDEEVEALKAIIKAKAPGCSPIKAATWM